MMATPAATPTPIPALTATRLSELVLGGRLSIEDGRDVGMVLLPRIGEAEVSRAGALAVCKALLKGFEEAEVSRAIEMGVGRLVPAVDVVEIMVWIVAGPKWKTREGVAQQSSSEVELQQYFPEVHATTELVMFNKFGTRPSPP